MSVIIGSGPGIPFAGGVQHMSQDGQTGKCGYRRKDADLVLADGELHDVWVTLCRECYGWAIMGAKTSTSTPDGG